MLCEKPFAWSAADAASCFDAAEAAARVCAGGFMWRTHPQTRLARQLVADGAIGRQPTGRPALRVPIGAGDIRRSAELGGGDLGDLGYYCVSAIRLFGGEPVRVAADGVFDGVDTRLGGVLQCPGGVPQCPGGVLQCPGGVLGVFDCALDLPRADELDIVGTEGVLRLPDPWPCTAGEVHLIRRARPSAFPPTPTAPSTPTGLEHDAYRIEFDTFEQAATRARPHPFGRSDAVAQAATLEALRQAARTGKPHPH